MDRSAQPDVIVVGAGFAGLYAIHRFREQGLNVLALEAAPDVGGTWYWNRYPGCRCDVPSIEYSYGFSPELDQEWHWPEVFSAQPDILRYANHVADRFDLRRHIHFDTRVASVRFDEHAAEWTVTSESGETFRAPFCVMATGCLSVPNTPDLPGLDSFTGRQLHIGHWPEGEVDLTGLRVGVIGTGSSGVQAIPELAKQAAHLVVFQRTPVYTVPAFRGAMEPDLEREFKAHYPEIRRRQQFTPRGVSNYVPFRTPADEPPELAGRDESTIDGRPNFRGTTGGDLLDLTPEQRKERVRRQGPVTLLNFRDVYIDPEANETANELFREYVAEQVDDPVTAEALMPRTYGLGCKRPVLDRDYYATFNRPHVTLVDLAATPIETVNAAGIRTTAAQHDLDVIVHATGFDAMTGALLRANLVGRDGLALADRWAEGPETYLGLQIPGFPNLFTVTGPGSPSVLCNMLTAIQQHVDWIGDCIAHLRNKGHATVEATEDATREWVAHVNEVAAGTMYTAPTCNSWYLGANIPGKARVFMPYSGGYARYREHCERVVADGYAGFRFTGDAGASGPQTGANSLREAGTEAGT